MLKRGKQFLGGNAYDGRVVRIAEEAGDEGILKGLEFTDCAIKGPAVLVLQSCQGAVV